MRDPAVVMLLVLLAGVALADDLSDANEYFLSGQYEKAITSYGRALGSASDKAGIYYNMGVCHEKLGNLELAVSYYKRAGNVKDASQAASRLEEEVKKRKVSRLREEAERAYEAMNYGVARSKAEEILKLDPSNGWAGSFLASLDEERVKDTVSQIPETLVQPRAETLIKALASDTLAVSEKPGIPLGFWLGAGILVIAACFLGFVLGRMGRRDTAQRAIRTLVRLLPAGMLSLRQAGKLGLLFFEEGKVIKALLEEDEGMIIEGKEVADELTGKGCTYADKGEGPWGRFADMVISVYREAQEEGRPKKKVRK